MARSRLLRVDNDFYDYVNAIKRKSGIPITTITKKMATDKSLIAVRGVKR